MALGKCILRLFRVSKAVQALPIKDEELILTADIQSDIGAESDVAKRVAAIADLTPAVECQRLQVRDIQYPVQFSLKLSQMRIILREPPYMITAKFLDFLTPSPIVRILN